MSDFDVAFPLPTVSLTVAAPDVGVAGLSVTPASASRDFPDDFSLHDPPHLWKLDRTQIVSQGLLAPSRPSALAQTDGLQAGG